MLNAVTTHPVSGQWLTERPLQIGTTCNRGWRNGYEDTAALVLSLSLAGGTLVAQDGSVRSLLSKDLAGVPGREVSMITVEVRARRIDPGAYASCAGAGLRTGRLDRDAGQR